MWQSLSYRRRWASPSCELERRRVRDGTLLTFHSPTHRARKVLTSHRDMIRAHRDQRRGVHSMNKQLTAIVHAVMSGSVGGMAGGLDDNSDDER